MTTNSRKARGMKTQSLVAEWFRPWWPFAESTGSGRSGVDILGMPGLACEVKATAKDTTLAALRQAHANRGGGLPFVVWRPNGHGEARIAEWPVIVRLDDFTKLLHAAGYGSAPDEGAGA